MKRTIAERGLDFYTIDATRVAREAGLGQRINTVMQAAFYHLSGVLPAEQARARGDESRVERASIDVPIRSSGFWSTRTC